MSTDRTPPAASAIDARFGDMAACLAHQDQIITGLVSEKDAMESRIHALEKANESLELIASRIDEHDPHAIRLANLEGQFAFLDSYVAQLWLHAGRPHVVFSEEHERVRRGLPRHGAPIGTGLIDVPEPEPIRRESHHIDGTTGEAVQT